MKIFLFFLFVFKGLEFYIVLLGFEILVEFRRDNSGFSLVFLEFNVCCRFFDVEIWRIYGGFSLYVRGFSGYLKVLFDLSV